MSTSTLPSKEKEVAVLGPMPDMKVVLDYAVYQKIMYLVTKAPGEISGLGKGEWTKEGAFKVTSAVLLKQENGAASTDLDPADVAKAMYELRNDPGHLNFWWHSHVNMDVFWSGTDTDTIRTIGRNGFVVATVFNKKKEMLSAFYTRANEALPEIYFDNIGTSVLSNLEASVVASWDKEYEEKCTVKTYPSPGNYYGRGYGNWDQSSWTGEYGYNDIPNRPLSIQEENDLAVAYEVRACTSDDSMTNVQKDEMICEIMRENSEGLVQLMLEQTTYNKARKYLNDIFRNINKVTFYNENVKVALKKEYTDDFNKNFPLPGRNLKEDPQGKLSVVRTEELPQ